MFTKVKENLTLKIQSEFMNRSDIEESIRKRVILYLSKEITIKRIFTENEPSKAESENDSSKSMWNIQIENNVKIENKLEDNVYKAYAVIFKELFPSLTQNRIKEHP